MYGSKTSPDPTPGTAPGCQKNLRCLVGGARFLRRIWTLFESMLHHNIAFSGVGRSFGGLENSRHPKRDVFAYESQLTSDVTPYPTGCKASNVGNGAKIDEIPMKLHFSERYGSIVQWGVRHFPW